MLPGILAPAKAVFAFDDATTIVGIATTDQPGDVTASARISMWGNLLVTRIVLPGHHTQPPGRCAMTSR
ncbi:hypothetical protein H2136_20185 [Aeromonas hydrophila]|uniref:Uncharacterized protein n=1 Tax=Aeromonas hydrophila TaxID=644 RepID=A0A926FKM0_AERHY|nr:hypothetical protein [Aeromonas hydrophila]